MLRDSNSLLTKVALALSLSIFISINSYTSSRCSVYARWYFLLFNIHRWMVRLQYLPYVFFSVERENNKCLNASFDQTTLLTGKEHKSVYACKRNMEERKTEYNVSVQSLNSLEIISSKSILQSIWKTFAQFVCEMMMIHVTQHENGILLQKEREKKKECAWGGFVRTSTNFILRCFEGKSIWHCVTREAGNLPFGASIKRICSSHGKKGDRMLRAFAFVWNSV